MSQPFQSHAFRCLWSEAGPPVADDRAGPPSQADVVVIGGGYTGLAAALALAREGAHVVVLERETIGWGASSRNGGFVLPGFKPDPAILVKKYGVVRARMLFEESLRSVGWLERFIAEERIECDYWRSGHLTLAETSRGLRALESTEKLLGSSFGHPVTLLGQEEIRREIGSDLYVGGLLDENAGCLQPAKLLAGLAAVTHSAGAALYPHTEARRIERKDGGFSIETSRAEIRSREVLLATNGYSGPVHPGFRRRIVPVASYIIATSPLDPALAGELIPHDRVLSDDRFLVHYFRLSPDRRMVFGGRASFSQRERAAEVFATRILQRDMIRTFPPLGGIPIEFAWSGHVGFTRDQMPHAGRLDGVTCAGGYCGHGVAMATYLGYRMGEYLGGRAPMPALATLDFPAIPLYNGRPWFLPLAGMWYRLKDRVGQR